MTLQNAANLLVSSPGSLAFHLTISITLALLFSLSRVYYTRLGNNRAARWSLASGWLISIELIQVAVSGMSGLAIAQGEFLLPSFSHFVSISGILMLGWAAVYPGQSGRGSRIVMGLLLFQVLSLPVALIGGQITGLSGLFSPQTTAAFWRVDALLIGTVLLAMLVYRRPAEWPLSAMALALIVSAYFVQMVFLPDLSPYSGLVRIAELIGYPLLALAGARAMALDRFQGREDQKLVEQAQVALAAPPRERELAVQLTGVLGLEDEAELIRRITRSVSEALRAEYCLLVSAPDDKGHFSLATAYDLIREQFVPGTALDEISMPVIAAAMREHRSVHVNAQSASADVYTLQSVLGLPSLGPTLFVPVHDGNRLYGGFILLSPFVRRGWTEEQRSSVEQIGRNLARAMRALRQPPIAGATDADAYQVLRESMERIRTLENENMRLFEALHDVRSDVDLPELPKVSDLQHKVSQAEDTIAILEAEIERLKSVKAVRPELPTSEELDQLSAELQAALEELVAARIENQRLREGGGPTAGEFDPGVDLEAISSIAQELRQPMSSIMGYTDLLLGESVGLLGAMQRKFLERVRTGIERMGTLLNDLIQVTALESGQLSLRLHSIDPLSCIEGALSKVGPTLQEKDLTLRIDLPESVPAVHADPEAVTQIVLHLMNNAIVVSPPAGQVALSAQIQIDDQEGYFMLSVSDSGDGIPPEDLGRVFQRLHQTDRLIIQGIGDAGIGLSLVKALSEAQGGRVWVESEVGVGSTFTILLPLVRQDIQQPST